MSLFTELNKNVSLFKFSRNNLVSFFIVILIFTIDRIAKIKIINHQVENNKIYINDFINLDLIWNTGIGFGLLSTNSNIFYNVMTAVIVGISIFIIYIIYKSDFLDKILFSLILGGALGNLFDRLFYFGVPDFIDVHYERFHWFTFNIADIFISVGIIILIIKDIFLKNEKKN